MSCHYSGTSDSGLSEKGTPGMLDLSIKDITQGPKNYSPYSIENLQEEDNLSIKDKTAEFILSPNVLHPEVPLYQLNP